MPEISNAFVVCMGIGTVFVGLVFIIVICKAVGFFCNIFVKKPAAPDNNRIVKSDDLSPDKRREIIAAVTAACAEDMGTDVSALRVVSFKKL